MSTPIRHFIRHYVEMVAAMFAGMIVLGIPAEGLLRLAGTSSGRLAPGVMFLEMALIMTIPMVALMRLRGHAWRPCWEMSASMFLPTFAAIGLLWAGAGDQDALMLLEHAVMLPAMLVAMLLRFDEYAGCGHTAREARA
jgi:flagellar biosynthetic protein FliP